MVTRAFLLEVQLLAETDRWVDGAHRLHMHLSTSLHFCVTVILTRAVLVRMRNCSVTQPPRLTFQPQAPLHSYRT